MKKVSAILFAVMLLAAGTALAADDPLQLVMQGNKVVTERKDGKAAEKLVELPEEVGAGDVLQYAINGVNTSKGALRNVSVVGDIPDGTVYVYKSVNGPKDGKTLVSIDGGKNYAKPPIKEKVTQPDGSVKEVEVPVDRYTNIRFVTDELGAGQKFSYTYRVVVK